MAFCSTTLFVRNFPASLKAEEKENLLKHFGALQTKCLAQGGKVKNSAFATFKSDQETKHALGRLHQLEVLGSRLIVQYAKESQKKHFPHLANFPEPKFQAPDKGQTQIPEDDLTSKLEEFHHKLNSISPNFGLLYPISPKLRYQYPPPSPTIISNIAHALIAVPKLYTQVLHLMNKMNLPAPFGPMTPAPPIQPDPLLLTMEQRQAILQAQDMESSEESELESDGEGNVQKPKAELPLKRPGGRTKRTVKRPKLQQLIAPPAAHHKETTAILPTEVFELPQEQASKKIEFKLNPMETPSIIAQQQQPAPATEVVEGGFGQFAPTQQANEDDQNQGNDSGAGSEFISRQELRNNKISRDEMRRMSIFKNYDTGEPTTRLYIKNLSKQVEEKDLRHIYGGYVDMKSEVECNMFDIRLMHEGRMKGQAFVNLPSEKKAQSALRDTNGYMLYGKPLVVHFARSAKPKDKDDQAKSKSSR